MNNARPIDSHLAKMREQQSLQRKANRLYRKAERMHPIPARKVFAQAEELAERAERIFR